MSDYILTYTGKKFYPLDPRPEDVDVVDIAHALSNLCRFTGHLREFYSVATHSTYVAQLSYDGQDDTPLYGLLHDASEAYISDVSRPVKYHPGFSAYLDFEKKLQSVIYKSFGLSDLMPTAVKEADSRMLVTEMRDLGMPGQFGSVEMPWAPYSFNVVSQSPKEAEEEFLELYYKLTENRLVAINGK